MPIHRLGSAIAFPDPHAADASGLLAVGGDLRPERLLAAYRLGIFPWYERRPVLWFCPDPRLVLRPAELRVARRLRRTLRQGRFELRLDSAFEQVIHACATTPRPDQIGTWITREMIDAYVALHRLGYAHSVEAWQDGRLAGGLYGVSLGAAFFGESMFHHVRDASKVALVALMEQLAAWDFELFDCQVHTEHVERFGAELWRRARFLAALEQALERPTRRGAWAFDPGRDPARP